MRIMITFSFLVLCQPAISQDYLSLLKKMEFESRKFKQGAEIKFIDSDPTVWSYEGFINLYNYKYGTKLEPSISGPYALEQTINTIFGDNPPPDLVVNKKVYDQVMTLENDINSLYSQIFMRTQAIRELKGIKLPMEEYIINTREDESNYPKEKERLKKTFTIDQLSDQIKKLKLDSATSQNNLNDLVINRYPVSYNYIQRKGVKDRNLVPVVNKPAQNKYAKWYESELKTIQAEIKNKFADVPKEILTDLLEANQMINEHMMFIDKWDELTRDKKKLFQPSVTGYAAVRWKCEKILKFKNIASIQPLALSAEALMNYVENNRKYYLFFMFISSLNERIAIVRTNTETMGLPIETTMKVVGEMKEIDFGQLQEDEAKVFQGFTFTRILLAGFSNHKGLDLLQTEIIEIFKCGEIDAYDLKDFNSVRGLKRLQIKCGSNCKCKIKNLKDVQGSLTFEVVQL
ncbi:MAG: hypothetical protein KF763_15465 [Cyclobacteriaceae bacterium]|nr:hypothetical protein [Cyclobacteriaceae bacterium]